SRLQQKIGEFQNIINKVEKMLEENKDSFNPDDKKTAEFYKERLQKIKKMHGMIQAVVGKISKNIFKFLFLKK
ncbi:hypothetical protein N9A72_00155, partial [bacterium]|nr:hypothetical protein [bacterium]